jgi:hypothetical protein
VLQVDYGDSETISDCSVVYVEFDRESLKLKDIHNIMIQVGMLSGLKPEEFSMTFPNTNRKFPYDPRILKKYFEARSRKANALAQRQALVAKTKELEDDIRDEIKSAQKGADQAQPGQEEAPAETPDQPGEAPAQEAPEEGGAGLAGEMDNITKESLINTLARLI